MAELVGGDGVPLAVAEALPLGNMLRCDPSSSVVDIEEQLVGGEKELLLACFAEIQRNKVQLL